MSDRQADARIKDAFHAAQRKAAPSFDTVWAAAEMRYRVEQRRYATVGGLVAVLAIVAIGILFFEERQADDEFLIADALMNKTQWAAPSDVLLPQHQFDVYREVPFLVDPTTVDEGSLL